MPENCEFVVNFAPELARAISEAKYLEKLGYSIPDIARSVALQEDKFISFQDSLHRCLQRYHSVLAQLTEAEVIRERERKRDRQTERERKQFLFSILF